MRPKLEENKKKKLVNFKLSPALTTILNEMVAMHQYKNKTEVVETAVLQLYDKERGL